jgi:myosin heavy subunit
MADKIKYDDLFNSQSFNKGFGDLKKQLANIEKQIASVKKSSSKVETKGNGKTSQANNKAIDETKKKITELTALQKERIKVEKQLKTTLAQNIQVKEKNARVLEKGRQALQNQKKDLKDIVRLQKAEKGSIQQLQSVNAILVKKRKQLNLTNRDNIKTYERLTNAIKRNETKLKSFDKAIGRHQRNVGNYGSALKNLGKNLVGAAGLVGGFQLLVGAIKQAAQTIIKFEKAQSKLGSILGTNKKGVKDLTAEAKKLGSQTAFTASQVTSLQIELAKLAFERGEIKDSTKGILDLAAATGIELSEAASIAGATLRAFGLDATEMGRVTEVLGISTTKSALDMSKLATIMPIVAATAKNAGVSIEKTTALVGVLADRGVDASTAGTGLRNIFLDLSKQGLTWEDAMNKINTATDKNKVSAELFGKRGATVATILAENEKSATKLEKALTGLNGELSEMAEEQLNNVAGQLTILDSKWNGLIHSIEDGEGVFGKAAKNIIKLLGNIIEELTFFSEGDWIMRMKIATNTFIDFASLGLVPLLELLTGKEIELFNTDLEETTDITKELTKELNNLELQIKLTGKQTPPQTQRILELKKALGLLKKESKETTEELKKQVQTLDEVSAKGMAMIDEGLTRVENTGKNITETTEQIEKDTLEAQKEANEEKIKADEEMYQKRLEKAILFADDVNNITQETSNFVTSLKELEFQFIDNQLQREVITQEEAEKKKQEINKKYANTEFAIKAAEIIANTAVGVSKALATLGPLAPPAVALISLTGAAQLAIANEQRLAIQGFAKGTDYLEDGSAPQGTDTIPIMADRGERIMTKKQNAFLKSQFGRNITNNELVNYVINAENQEKSVTFANDNSKLENIANNISNKMDSNRVDSNTKVVETVGNLTTITYKK